MNVLLSGNPSIHPMNELIIIDVLYNYLGYSVRYFPTAINSISIGTGD